MKEINFLYGKEQIRLNLPDDCFIYKSNYTKNNLSPVELLLRSITSPVGCESLEYLLKKRREGNVVIVVSDITRPIPYKEFLPDLLLLLEQFGISRKEIIILVATGMHRASTYAEHIMMFGEYIVNNYKIIDHECEKEEELQELEDCSWSGAKIKLNKHYVQAGFRIITGLVEPHFMAGFSGGRKSICPGLAGLNTVEKFHGYQFLNHSNATATILEDNPCHEENTSVARLCPADYTVNIVLDNDKHINAIVSGELFESHMAAVEHVKRCCCPQVKQQADVVITSSGGYPLDATFYQCVKGFVNCLPAVKTGGEIIAFGECIEQIGSEEYIGLMRKYKGNYLQFLEDIKNEKFFIKDQWQFQMHIRALMKVGLDNLHFYTSNIDRKDSSFLSVNLHAISKECIGKEIQNQINEAVEQEKIIAVFPEGPYCSPVVSTK